MRLKFNKEKCRKCGNRKLPIIYGFPSPKVLEMVTEGRAKLGGCVIGSEKFFCPNCDEGEEITRCGAT